jgi:hypothetical protein
MQNMEGDRDSDIRLQKRPVCLTALSNAQEGLTNTGKGGGI